ncbi:hypothetical protein ACFRI7_35350, partial [Streptomyces sp. NPDC056716]|uniref:hypothetical protein n=1 Tax=Streptomyces sp. NPDC056716 TaxID=3345922 RepID=UPI0036CE01EF
MTADEPTARMPDRAVCEWPAGTLAGTAVGLAEPTDQPTGPPTARMPDRAVCEWPAGTLAGTAVGLAEPTDQP